MRWRTGEDRGVSAPTSCQGPSPATEWLRKAIKRAAALPSPLPVPLELPLGQGGTTAAEEPGLWESGRRGLASQCWLHWAGSPGPPGMRRGWA